MLARLFSTREQYHRPPRLLHGKVLTYFPTPISHQELTKSPQEQDYVRGKEQGAG